MPSMTTARRAKASQRQGMMSVLAMLYLVLFSTLAVGFYSAVNTAVQISRNDLKVNRAQVSAESGMQFITHALGRLNIPGSTAPEALMDEVHAQLVAQLQGTANLGVHALGYAGGVITLPSGSDNFIPLDGEGGRFRATIARDGVRLVVTVTGTADGQISRAIRLQFDIAQRASAIFDYGVASRSPISMVGNTSIQGKSNPAQGSVLSTSNRVPTITMTGNSEISGDISMTNPSAALNIGSSCRVGGYSASSPEFDNHVHFDVTEPEFPTIDTSVFEPFATNIIDRSPSDTNKTYSNLRIKANTNPTFNGNTQINGVVYIETPNKVNFNGNLTLTGVIVVENNPKGDVSNNLIEFGGNVSFRGVEELPPSYGALRDLRYAMLLAPQFKLKMRGNFGVIAGTIVASEMEFSGNAGGTIRGSVINLEDTAVSLQGNTGITIESQGSGAIPAGLTFGSRYVPLPDTYTEVMP